MSTSTMSPPMPAPAARPIASALPDTAVPDVFGSAAPTVPEFRWITVTPEVASNWLTRYAGPNRSVSRKTVQKFADDMKNGAWMDNGETLKFSRHGSLMDGQHRLHAVVESNVPVRFLVIAGLEPAAMRTIDTGRSRNFADVLSIRKVSNARAVASVAKAIFMYEHGLMIGGGYPVSHSQLDEVISRHPFIHDAVREVARTKTWLQPLSIVAMVYTLAHEKNPAMAESWLFDVQNGTNLDADNPAYLLRERLRNQESHRNRLQPAYATAYTIKSWNAYQAEKTLRTLFWRGSGPTAEKMPEIE